MMRKLLVWLALLALPTQVLAEVPFPPGLNYAPGTTKGNLAANGAPYGWQNTAALFSVLGDNSGVTQVMGGFGAGVSAIAGYGSIDTVGSYVSNTNHAPNIILTGATYDATHVFPATALTPTQIATLKVNQFILTGGSPNYETYITGWATNGTSITVVGWATPGGANATPGQVPSGAGTSTAYIGVTNNIFGMNVVTTLGTGFSGNAHGTEFDIINGTNAYNAGTDTPHIAGVDILLLGYTGTGAGATQGLGISGKFFNAITLSSIYGNFVFANNTVGLTWTMNANDGTQDVGTQSGAAAQTPTYNFHSNGAAIIDSALTGAGGNGQKYGGRMMMHTGLLEVISPNQTIADPGAVPSNGNAVVFQSAATGVQASITTAGDTNGKLIVAPAGAGVLQLGGTGASSVVVNPPVIQLGNPSVWSANTSVATALTSVGPAGSHTTVQEWLTITDSGGTVRYIPAF